MPEMWGQSRQFARDAINFGFENTRYSKVVVFIPEFNTLAVSLCEDIGFEKVGVITESFLKNFETHDQIIMSLGKYERKESCQRQ